MKRHCATMLLAGAALLAAPAAAQPASSTMSSAPSAAAAEDKRLLDFLNRVFEEAVAESPQALTARGIRKDYGKLDDYTEAAGQRQLQRALASLAEMKATFDYARLGPAGQLNYRMFEKSVRTSERQFKWRWHLPQITPRGSAIGNIPFFLTSLHRIDTVADAEAYVARVKEVERVMGEVAANFRAQADRGVVPAKLVFAPARADARKLLAGAPFEEGADGSLLADFKKKVAALDASEEVKARLIDEAAAALRGPFKRGYDTILATLDAIEPRSKGDLGVWSLPDGDAYYADQLRFYTTTDLTADQIHRIGLQEVARIKQAMERVKEKVGFKGTLEQFFTHVKTDPRFTYPNTDEGRARYLKGSDAYIAQLLQAAPRYFHRLPKAPVVSRAVEKWREGTAGAAFYTRPAPDGSRPGTVYYNLADMSSKLVPQLEATAYHEGAPGHHFQGASQQELTDIPDFRRFASYSAYGEGWGLYAERLGQEMGFYRDPYSEFGMLSLELWRATRLVLDTGIHAKRWSRAQALDYFRKNALLSEIDIERETDRYILDPGQATSYKIGQLKILELREKARKALGPKFDIRDFHAVILDTGAVPLDIMAEQVDAYIAAKKAG